MYTHFLFALPCLSGVVWLMLLLSLHNKMKMGGSEMRERRPHLSLSSSSSFDYINLGFSRYNHEFRREVVRSEWDFLNTPKPRFIIIITVPYYVLI